MSTQPFKFSGISENADLEPHILKDSMAMPAYQKRRIFYRQANAFFVFFTSLPLISSIIIPLVFLTSAYEVLALLGVFFYFQAMKNKIVYKIEKPVFEGGKGVLLLGRDREDMSNIMTSDGSCRAHILVFGSTGSGKTRFLMSILYQSMVMGSGCMYVDGKADNTVFWLVYSICQRLDRVDDFVLINYLTTPETLLKEKNAAIRGNKKILTNTMNPYSTGSDEQLRSMTVGLMRDSGGDGDMWKGRASSLLSGTMRFLAHLREMDIIQMSVMSIRDSMPLDNVLRIVHGEYNGTSKIKIADNIIDMKKLELPEYATRPLAKYLADLPGYNEKDVADEIAPECYKQHGFLTMQLTEALADLSETYGHIFNAPIGEVDFSDLIYGNRILFVMLPALQRDPDALANLGKLVVATIRSALAPALGSEVEGIKTVVIDQKATNFDVPYFIILDEYGYYAVKGFAVVAAQARSLGVSVVFAGQDYAGFKKANAEEAESVLANTNTKIGMKLEDSNTVEIYVKRAGQSTTPIRKGLEAVSGFAGRKYKQRDDVSYERMNKIDENDLFGQKAGQAHIIIDNKVHRVSLFSLLVEGEGNGQTHEVMGTQLNRFVMVRPPKPQFVEDMKLKTKKVHNLMHYDDARESKIKVKRSQHVDNLINEFRSQLKSHNNIIDSGICGIASMLFTSDEKDDIVSEFEKSKKPEKEGAISGKEKYNEVIKGKENEFNNISEIDGDNDENDYVGINHREGDFKNSSMKKDAEKASNIFENLIDNITSVNGCKPMREQLKNVAKDYYEDEKSADDDVNKSLEIMEDRFNNYPPKNPTPKKPESNMLKSKLGSLKNKLVVDIESKENDNDDYNDETKDDNDIDKFFEDEDI